MALTPESRERIIFFWCLVELSVEAGRSNSENLAETVMHAVHHHLRHAGLDQHVADDAVGDGFGVGDQIHGLANHGAGHFAADLSEVVIRHGSAAPKRRRQVAKHKHAWVEGYGLAEAGEMVSTWLKS